MTRRPDWISPRQHFTAATKRAIDERSGGVCEAHLIPARYGLPKVCEREAVDYDHVLPDGFDGPPTVENGAKLCVPCHKIKSAIDKADIAKADRRGMRTGQQARRHRNGSSFRKPEGYVSPLSKDHRNYRKPTIQSRGFGK